MGVNLFSGRQTTPLWCGYSETRFINTSATRKLSARQAELSLSQLSRKRSMYQSPKGPHRIRQIPPGIPQGTRTYRTPNRPPRSPPCIQKNYAKKKRIREKQYAAPLRHCATRVKKKIDRSQAAQCGTAGHYKEIGQRCHTHLAPIKSFTSALHQNPVFTFLVLIILLTTYYH